LVLAISFTTRPSYAQDKGKPPIFQAEDKLTLSDPRDNVFKKSFQKTHAVKLDAGPLVRIDLRSTDFDAYLRLEDPTGKIVAEDDSSGGNLNSRILYKVDKAGMYKLIVTSYDPEKSGKYVVSVAEASVRDLLVLRSQKLLTTDKKERTLLVADVKKHLAEQGGAVQREDLSLAVDIAMGLEESEPDLAADAFNDFGALLAKSSDKVVAKYSATMIGAGRRLKSPGQEMVIKGTAMDGKPFDAKAYRGKLVLVDFWATWNAPCKAELPNLRKLFETYKDQGFVIVGVSIDRDRGELEKFLAKEKLPWICLHEKDAPDGQPLAEYYGVITIPRAVLVDRDGKVITWRAHGGELGRLLEKHISAAKVPVK